MSLNVIDYSETCLDADALRQPRRGKFIVLSNRIQRFAAFAPTELAVYHANIVERFLRDVGVSGVYNDKGDVFAFASAQWSIEGGGHWELDPERRLLAIWGQSLSYGPVDLDSLAADLSETGAFDGAEVSLRE